MSNICLPAYACHCHLVYRRRPLGLPPARHALSRAVSGSIPHLSRDIGAEEWVAGEAAHPFSGSHHSLERCLVTLGPVTRLSTRTRWGLLCLSTGGRLRPRSLDQQFPYELRYHLTVIAEPGTCLHPSPTLSSRSRSLELPLESPPLGFRNEWHN